MSKNMWIVRAGEGAYIIDEFQKKNIIAIGWNRRKDASSLKNKEEVKKLILYNYQEKKKHQNIVSVGQFSRFLLEFKKGDYVLSYNPDEREYLVGEISSDYEFNTKLSEYHHIRKVKWIGKVQRDKLSTSTRNTLGATSTIFELKDEAKKEILNVLEGKETIKDEIDDEVQEEKLKEDEIPYELPKGWVWTRLNEVTKQITDGDHKTPPKIKEGEKLLSAKNIRNGYIDYFNCDYISVENYDKSRSHCFPEKGDLLIVSVGRTIGRTSLILEQDDFALVRSVALIKPLLIDSQYLRVVINSTLMQEFIESTKRGGAQPCLYLSVISKFIFPLPPIIEQKRITEKTEQLIKYCSKLESEIKQNQKHSEALMNAVLKEAFEV